MLHLVDPEDAVVSVESQVNEMHAEMIRKKYMDVYHFLWNAYKKWIDEWTGVTG